MTKAAGKATDTLKDTAKDTAKKAQDAAPTPELKDLLGQLASVLVNRAVSAVGDKVSDTAGGVADRLNEYAQGGGHGGLLAAVTGARKLAEGKGPLRAALSAGVSGIGDKVKSAVGLGGGDGGGEGKRDLKVTNIVESIDVGVPVDLAYDLWTRFTDFPKFMKKVENIEQPSDEKTVWKAQVWWSHRLWEATIIDQVPGEHIVWRSKGEKGTVDGAVTFHEIAPRLTRILVVLEYHPKGFVEQTGNIWRAPGRRARLELKHFRRYAMTWALLHPDEVEGWHGEIHDGEVISEGEEAEEGEQEQDEGEYEEEPEEQDEDEYEEEAESEPEPPRRGRRRREVRT